VSSGANDIAKPTTRPDPLDNLLIQVLIPLLVVAHDRIVAKRIHPASIWGSAAVIGTLLFSTPVANTEVAQFAGPLDGPLAAIPTRAQCPRLNA